MTYIILDRGIWTSEDDGGYQMISPYTVVSKDDEGWNIHITNWRKKNFLGKDIDNFREFE